MPGGHDPRGALMRLAYQTNTWGGVVGHPVGVTSIKDLYYLANGSTEDALRDIATAGYEGVELFDDNLGAGLDAVVEIAERHGLAATYHPHLSTIVETPDQVDKILERTSIGLCPDTGHVIAGGGDPAQLISRHAARIPYVHLKDIDTETGSFVPLGQGALDVDGVMGALTAAGYDGWITVELDAWDDPLAGAAASHRRLEPPLAGASNVGQG